jgi:hypothetical protein
VITQQPKGNCKASTSKKENKQYTQTKDGRQNKETFDEFYLLGYNAVQSVESQPTFRSRLHLQGRRALFATCFHAGFLLGLFFDVEDGGNMFLRKIG